MTISGKMHICRAYGCNWRINEEFLMCYKHWQKVPAVLKASIYATMPKRGELPSIEYARTVRACINAVKALEYPAPADVSTSAADQLEGLSNADDR